MPVVLAEHAAGAGHRVCPQVSCRAVIPEREKVCGEVVGTGQGMRVVLADELAAVPRAAPEARLVARVPGPWSPRDARVIGTRPVAGAI